MSAEGVVSPDKASDETWGVRFVFDAHNPGPGEWIQQTLFGLTSEEAARHFYRAAVTHPHMRDVELVHGDNIVERDSGDG